MGTAKIDWDTSWTDDATMTSAITDTNAGLSAAYDNDGTMMHQFAVDIDYAGTYDGPCIAYVIRKTSDTNYEEHVNAYAAYAINGAASTAARKVFTVGPEVGEFKISIQNDTGATLTACDLDYKQGHVITT